jgi:hypothetical protein
MLIPNPRLLVLTFAGVFVEITYCVWGLSRAGGLWIVPLILGAHHAGYIAARVRWFSARPTLSAALALAALVMLALGFGESSWPMVAVGAFVLSAAVQSLRRTLKVQGPVPSKFKNLAKTFGMMAGSVGALSPAVLALTILGVAAGLIPALFGIAAAPPPRQEPARAPARPRLLWFELAHHAHYFAYCYTFWALMPRDLIPFVGPLFVAGWFGYFVLERLLRERTSLYDGTILSAGHLICAAALWGMAVTDSVALILGLWFVTGIGGGTAYMLGNVPNGGDRELYEDVGHVVGCAGAALLTFVAGAAEFSLYLGLAFALGAALLALGTGGRSRPRAAMVA